MPENTTCSKKASTIAIDMTRWEYYDKGLKPEMLKTKPKNGTARFHSFMTAQMVNQAGNCLHIV